MDWKFYRLIGLVILWSNCLKVAFADNLTALPECTVPTEENAQCTAKTTAFAADTYCKTSDGKIYKSINGTPSCTIDDTNTTGYVLFDCGDGKCEKLENLSTTPTRNLLVYHCKFDSNACIWTQNKVSYYMSDNKLYQCSGTAPCTAATGVFYLTITNSNSDTVKLVSVNEGASTVLSNLSGKYYIDSSNPGSSVGTSTKLIYCSSETECKTGQTASAGIYINGNPDKITNALISCTGTGSTITCKEINGIDGKYYVNTKTHGLIKCVTDTGCADEATVITTGYYIDESSQDTESTETNKPYKNLISCSSPTGCSSTLASTTGNGYYINAGVTAIATDGLINCTNGSCLVAVVTVTVENHYLDAKTKQLITCTTTACTLENNTLKGYFLNSDITSGKVIKCTGATTNSCLVVPDTTAFSTTNPVGSIKVDGSTVKLCLTANCKESTAVDGTDVIEIKADASGTDVYKSMTVAANGFPGVDEDKKIALKVGSNGTAVPLEEASLPECNSVTATAACTIASGTLVNGGHCIKNYKIYKTDTTNNKCAQLIEDASSTKEEGDKVISYFDINSGYTTATINDNAELLVYECILDSNKKYDECGIVKGYTNNGTKYIQCNGWKREKCVVADSITGECTATSNGILGTGDKVCFSATESQNVELPTDSTENKIAFNSTDTSSAYGTLKDDIVFLVLSEKKAMVDKTPLGEGKKYFINYTGEDDKQNQIIYCEDENCKNVASNAGYYLDSGSETVISITTTKKRTKTNTIKTITVVTISHAKLISCPIEDKVCTSLPTPSPGFYVDASSAQTTTSSDGTAVTTYSKLIKCVVEKDESNQNLPPVCELITFPKAGFYINAIPDETDKFKESLIECTGEGKNVTCQVKTLDGTKDKDSIFINNYTGKLIQCIEKDTKGCQEFPSTGTSVVPAFYVNGGKAGSFAPTTATKNYSDLLIRCTNEKCVLANGGENNVYLNANLKGTTNGAMQNAVINDNSGDKTNHLIICSEGKCELSADAATSINYYINNGVDSYATNKIKSALIKCSSSGTPKCSLSDATLGTGVTENFYINANVAKDKVHYLIKCSNNGCEPFTTTNASAAAGDIEYYVHGAQTALEDAIIQCPLTEVTAARKRDPVQPKKFTSTCVFVATPVANQIYINSFNKNLIQCYGTVCVAFSGVLGSVSNPAYYVNAASISTDYTSQLIKCTGSSCEVVDGVENAVYINSNFKDNLNPNGVTDKRLIICDKNSKKCDLAEVGQSITGISYFLNGNSIVTTPTQRRAGPSLVNAIIKCPANASPLQPCKTLTGVKDGVYLNANFNLTTKQVIKCTLEGGCIEDAAYADGVSGLIYYVNAGSVDNDKLKDTLIKCETATAACAIKADASNEEIYINAFDNQLILCYTDKGCIGSTTKASDDKNEFYLNSSDLQNAQDKLTNDLIKCSISISNDEAKTKIKKCEPYIGEDKKVYINSYDTSKLIYCLTNEGCAIKNSNAIINRPEYYVNGDDIDFKEKVVVKRSDEKIDSDPLNGDLIECKKNNDSIRCSVINGHHGDVYINANFNTTKIENKAVGDDTNPLIKCSTDNGCVIAEVKGDNEALPLYYINSGNRAKNKLEEAIIKCTKEKTACDVIKSKENEIYVNSNENQPEKPIIKCIKNNCSAVMSRATKSSKEYYINSGKVGDTPLQYDIIECSISSNNSLDKRTGNNETTNVSCKCLEPEEISKGVYINTNYSESGDKNQLIQCSDDNGCVGVSSESTSNIAEYYVNAESTDLNNAIIFCFKKKCEKQTPADINKYYVGKDGDNVNGLIECVKSIVTTKEKIRKRATDDTVNKCTLKSAFTSQGYYMNNGYNKSMNQTILCDSIDGCSTLKVDLGYYVNAGNSKKPIIKCEKVGSECVEEVANSCSDLANAVPGNYCYENDQLKFFNAYKSTAIAASKYDDFYTFATIQSDGFPGIKRATGALFKISRLFINRFYQSGVVMIDKNGKLVDILGGDQSNVSLYDCNEITKVCTESPGCTPNTYMLDSENAKVIFCNNGNLEYAKFTGYVVDGNRVTNGNKSSYIIYCEEGEKCISFKPKTSTYYENSGYDSKSNSLIQCRNSNCITVTADTGYYIGHGENGNHGIIKCSSPTSCTYSQVKNKVKFVNAGLDKKNNAIIECKINGNCKVAKAKKGYYLTHTSTLLIHCTSPNSCTEIKPSANYYNNADSSESNNTIINCVQNGKVVTCATEATNNGFYMSSSSNILIRCKAGSKCKTTTVKNGIFRGAVKGLTSKKRHLEDDDSLQIIDVLMDRKEKLVGKNFSSFNSRDADDHLEENGREVSLRDNNDDAYGVIRCIAGKCVALSPSELASIPICEFFNNKCYITLEYSMTKSATTFISAGNICTNNDRSVFYFATDTVVVKPNVISGVTSTYVYTTTNSNCLEVSDSYNNMYFTVGSNIYTLEQGSVLQFYENGYYFLNIAKNTLVKSNYIEAYNDENVKLYRCNGSKCSIVDKPEVTTYYADVNKRIMKYDVNNGVYDFAYEKEIICIFDDNKCTPNADLKNHEFCITYKGEIVLATTDIKNRETGECYLANSINNYIYGYSYSQRLYHMNQFEAQMIDQTGYYIINRATNMTVASRNYNAKNSNLVMYGCTRFSCRIYEPEEDTYYYDAQVKNILKYKDGVWSSPNTSGYAYISINPTHTYIYKFIKNGEEITIHDRAKDGYYYTVDQEMYYCDQEEGTCTPVDDTDYYFTNTGEIYYCIHDSEELEPTECTKKLCINNQYYYIDGTYYRCEANSILVPVISRYCSYEDRVIINFPLALTEEFPKQIKQAVDNIKKHNNSTAVIRSRNKNNIDSVSGIFTNCTYNVEETLSSFDLVCINNYVTVDEETEDVKICSIDHLGYVDCIENEDNPEKCNISAAYNLLKPSLFVIIITVIGTFIQRLL